MNELNRWVCFRGSVLLNVPLFAQVSMTFSRLFLDVQQTAWTCRAGQRLATISCFLTTKWPLLEAKIGWRKELLYHSTQINAKFLNALVTPHIYCRAFVRKSTKMTCSDIFRPFLKVSSNITIYPCSRASCTKESLTVRASRSEFDPSFAPTIFSLISGTLWQDLKMKPMLCSRELNLTATRWTICSTELDSWEFTHTKPCKSELAFFSNDSEWPIHSVKNFLLFLKLFSQNWQKLATGRWWTAFQFINLTTAQFWAFWWTTAMMEISTSFYHDCDCFVLWTGT